MSGRLYVTVLLQLYVDGDEWDCETQTEETEVKEGIWDPSVQDLEWKVAVDTLLEVDWL